MPKELDRALEALYSIPPSLPRPDWVRVGMAAHAVGIDFAAFNDWSAGADNYDERAARATWNSFKPGKGIGPGTLFMMAAQCEGRQCAGKPQSVATPALQQAVEPAPGMNAAEVLSRCLAATDGHPYIVAKGAAGVPLDGLLVLPDGDALRIGGESMAGALVVPVLRADGTASSQQFITSHEVAARLKSKGMSGKLNLPNHIMEGFYTVGELVPGGVAYLVEGIGAAWSCWQASGQAAVVCFGWGRVRKVATDLRQRDPGARLVLMPDVGKEHAAATIAMEVGAAVVNMPEGWANNSDVNDLAQRDGLAALTVLLASASEPPQPAPRYKLLGASDLRDLPPLAWSVQGVLPEMGLAAVFGPSGCGKSFLLFDMAAAIAEGRPWFSHQTKAAPVVYCALEGEAGFKLRAAAWEQHHGRALPADLHLVLQPFQLTKPQDVADLAAVVPPGAVLIIDTLNRAAPMADENSSKDMGEILSRAKELQNLTKGLVVLAHHTGKNTAAGMRGHSSLYAALDAAVEVSRKGQRREWKVAKSKDGRDGDIHPFTLKIETLGNDAHGDPMTSCVVLSDSAAKSVSAVKLPQGGNQRLVFDALLPLFKAGSTDYSGAPKGHPCIALETAVITGAALLPCSSDKRTSRAKAAIAGLVKRGALGLSEGFLWKA
ncbi:Primase C terminal 2 (PriCT-2) [Polaromonas sp. OV174]|uniref:AAA family ATPase n=1 Tax=Polaromonas sp. OV174 TaxID=1855300 RepID=UPI0008F1C9B8|nr:AAA family ATPase [Polaromonas sp. OV174]SFC33967.1 Primase C terminal 2 (PriCT-2) [Polaromonas sp. OV174]